MGEMLLTISEAARVLGVSAQTVRVWADSGKLPTTRTEAGSMRLFQRNDVESYAARRSHRDDEAA